MPSGLRAFFMISLYFGLPGCGKTTLLVKHAIQGLKKYSNVYCNVPISVPGVIYVHNSEIGYRQIENGLLLIDEASIFADSRDFNTSLKGLYYEKFYHYQK